MVFEKCCIYGKETTVRFDTPIDQRTGYLEGAGQLCISCYRSICGFQQDKDQNLVQAALNGAREDYAADTSGPSK